jgi:hypothetical protein
VFLDVQVDSSPILMLLWIHANKIFFCFKNHTSEAIGSIQCLLSHLHASVITAIDSCLSFHSRDVLKNAHCCPSGHRFCLACITQHLNMSGGVGQCPNDRGHLTLQSLQVVLNISGFVDNLLVRCSTTLETEGDENEVGGCEWTGPLGNLSVHIRDQCQFHIVSCPLVGCDTQIRRQELVEHLAQCPHRLVSCQHCQVRLQFANIAIHERQCPHSIQTCPYSCGAHLVR